MPTITAPLSPSTPAQANFYGSLCAQFAEAMGGLAGGPEEAKAKGVAWAATHNKGEVSKAIDTLKTKVAALPKPKSADVLPGYYAKGESFFFVTTAKSSGKTYAKKWEVKPGNVKASWVYAPGAVKGLTGLKPMSLEDAKAFGHAHGYCLKCGAQLTDPVSVEAGVGPICAKYWA